MFNISLVWLLGFAPRHPLRRPQSCTAAKPPSVDHELAVQAAACRRGRRFRRSSGLNDNCLPEPVLAIYEPAILPTLEKAKLSGYSLICFCAMFRSSHGSGSAGELLNVNDPKEYREFRRSYVKAGRKD